MASKFSLVLLVSALAALLFVADASFLRTTIEEIEEENPSRGCTRIRMNLTPCMKWMKNMGSWNDEEMNPDQYKQQCCSMMSRLGDKECMCSALKSTFTEKCMSGSQGRGEMCGPKMTEKLMDVPKMCGLTDERCGYMMLLV